MTGNRHIRASATAYLAALLLTATAAAQQEGEQPNARPLPASQLLSSTQVAFEPNRGQWPSEIRFAAHWGPIMMTFTTDSMVMTVPAGPEGGSPPPEVLTRPLSLQERFLQRRPRPTFKNVTMRFRGANATLNVVGLEPLPGKSYYIAPGRTDAPTGAIPRFGRLEYRNVYPGVDLVFYTSEGRLEYDVVVQPGSDPAVVDFEFEGMDQIRVADDGDLVLETPGGRLCHRRPSAFAEADRSKEAVPTAFRLNGRRLGFQVSKRDRRKRLRIDPVIDWETTADAGTSPSPGGVAADVGGNAYVTGTIVDPSAFTQKALFVSKYDTDGQVVYQTVLQAAGPWWLKAGDIAVDATGAAYALGIIGHNSDFKFAAGLAKLVPDGSALAFPVVEIKEQNGWTLGNHYTWGRGVAVDVGGNAYVVGGTLGGDGLYPDGSISEGRFTCPGGELGACSFVQWGTFPLPRPINTGGAVDAFVAVVGPDGEIHTQALFGGSNSDLAADVTVDRAGAVYIVGVTDSPDFPTSEQSLQGSLADNPCTYDGTPATWFCQQTGDTFVVKLTPGAAAVSFSTLLGGNSGDAPQSVTVDRWGSVYVAGGTTSADFPRTGSDEQPVAGLEQLATLVKLNRQGTTLRYARVYAPPNATGPGGFSLANDIAVSSEGTSFWLVSTCSPWLITLSRSGDVLEEHELYPTGGDTNCIVSGMGVAFPRTAAVTTDAQGNLYVAVQRTWTTAGSGDSEARLYGFATGRALMRSDGRCHGECVAANPAHRVSAVTGNAWLDQGDGEGLDNGGLLPFVRSYNSQAAAEGVPGPLGPGWSHSYSRHIEFAAGGVLRVIEDDGVPTVYSDPDQDGHFEPATPITERSWIDRNSTGYTRFFREEDTEEYDTYGRLVGVEEASGNSVTLVRDGTDQVTAIQSSIDATLDLAYEDTPNEIRLIRISTGATTLATYEYDERGRLSKVDRPARGYLSFRYDDADQLLSVTDSTGSVITAFTYDDEYRATQSDIGAGQERYSFAYGADQTSVTDVQGWTTTYGWNEIEGMRSVTSQTMPCETCGGGGSYVDAWTYTPEGRVASHSANGLLTHFTYHPQGDVETVVDPQLRTTSYEYNYAASGRMLSRTRNSPGGAAVQWAFGPSGVTAVSEGVSEGVTRSVSFAYESGRVSSVSDAAGKVWKFERDSQGNVSALTTPTSARTAYNRDALGRVTSITNPLGHATTLVYEGSGLLKRVEQPDDAKTEFSYDATGKLTTTTDALNRSTRRSYDDRGRLTGLVDAGSGSTAFSYDRLSRLTRLTDAEGRASRFQYNGDGSLKKSLWPGGAEEGYVYNPHGWLTQRTDRRGVVTTYSYDTVGRLTGKSYSDGTPSVTFTYDLAGRLETATNETGTLTWIYDLAGQPLTEASTRGGGTTIGYTYGLRGNRLSTSLNGTLVAGYGYDDDGRVTSVSTGAGDFALQYDAASRRTQLIHPNGVTTDYGYDERSRLTTVVAHQTSGVVASHLYTYDSVGNRLTKTTQDVSESYSYDALDRLKSVVRSGTGGAQTFGYDRVGNRLTLQSDTGAQGATYDVRNQLNATTGSATLLFRGTLDEPGAVAVNGKPARMISDRIFEADVPVVPGENTVTVEAWDSAGNRKTDVFSVTQSASSATFQHDATGNLTQRVEGSDTWTYEWDAESQLKRVRKNGAEVASFLYDPLGRRAQKVEGGITYEYTYDGQDILREARSDGSVYSYAHGPGIDEPLARISNSGPTVFYHADGLGSIVKMTDSTGTAVATKQYDAWGNLEGGASEPGYAFTGREWDPETGLYYYRARYYDPKIGRFISEDPIGFVGRDVNLFSYVSNNPSRWTDPTGLLQVDPVTAMLYPKATARILSIDRRLSDRRLAAFMKYGTSTREQVKAACTPGKGPTVTAINLTPAYGEYAPGSSNIGIDYGVLEAFESGRPGSRQLLDATVEHELTHYLDAQDSIDYPGEEGFLYEAAVYGQVVNGKVHP